MLLPDEVFVDEPPLAPEEPPDLPTLPPLLPEVPPPLPPLLEVLPLELPPGPAFCGLALEAFCANMLAQEIKTKDARRSTTPKRQIDRHSLVIPDPLAIACLL